VYRTFGIGLGFNFDHMTAVNGTKAPSIRRLQSRAAKSAIQRVTEIFNSERILVELSQLNGDSERQHRAATLRHEAEMEVKHLADRLADLIPNQSSWDESELELRIEQYSSGNVLRASSQAFRLPSIETESPALRKLFDKYTMLAKPTMTYEVDYMNPMGSSELSADDEFIIEWNEQNKAGAMENSQDGENSTEPILV
jgi:hypothetical protein